MKNKLLTIIISGLLIISVSGCSVATKENNQIESVPSTIIADTNTNTEIKTTDTTNTTENIEPTKTTASNETSTEIIFSESEATIIGEGAVLKDSTLLITQGGTYNLEGDFIGSVLITTPSTDKVQLILNSVNIKADRNSAIYCTQSDLLTITIAEGSVNTLTDSTNFIYADATAEEPDATIFSKTDLTIEGTGSLKVVANYNNGIGTKDDLIITSGDFEVVAANHGIRGRDSLTVLGGNFNITATADGIQSNNDEDTSKGWISLKGGSYNIVAGNDAIQSETTLNISGGTYIITTGGGSTAKSLDSASSYKGIKAGTNMTISEGDFTINSGDDTIHSNGNIAITGGVFNLATGDDGIHADGDLTVSGESTKINVNTSYEGIEAKTMTISDGTIIINSNDDGINIAGGNDVATGGTFGKDSFSSRNTEQWLLISGGNITVKAGSDAIDINGSGKMTGGTVNITAALLGEGQTLDVDSTWEQTGGDLTETGGNSMEGGGHGGRR